MRVHATRSPNASSEELALRALSVVFAHLLLCSSSPVPSPRVALLAAQAAQTREQLLRHTHRHTHIQTQTHSEEGEGEEEEEEEFLARVFSPSAQAMLSRASASAISLAAQAHDEALLGEELARLSLAAEQSFAEEFSSQALHTLSARETLSRATQFVQRHWSRGSLLLEYSACLQSLALCEDLLALRREIRESLHRCFSLTHTRTGSLSSVVYSLCAFLRLDEALSLAESAFLPISLFPRLLRAERESLPQTIARRFRAVLAEDSVDVSASVSVGVTVSAQEIAETLLDDVLSRLQEKTVGSVAAAQSLSLSLAQLAQAVRLVMRSHNTHTHTAGAPRSALSQRLSGSLSPCTQIQCLLSLSAENARQAEYASCKQRSVVHDWMRAPNAALTCFFSATNACNRRSLTHRETLAKNKEREIVREMLCRAAVCFDLFTIHNAHIACQISKQTLDNTRTQEEEQQEYDIHILLGECFRLMFHLLSALAKTERESDAERTLKELIVFAQRAVAIASSPSLRESESHRRLAALYIALSSLRWPALRLGQFVPFSSLVLFKKETRCRTLQDVEREIKEVEKQLSASLNEFTW